MMIIIQKELTKKIKSDLFWLKFADAIKENNLRYAINKYSSVGTYVLNDYGEMDELCRHISYYFF